MGIETKIEELYYNINYMGYRNICRGADDYVEKAKNLIPSIQEFTQWFLSGNQFGIEEELYVALQQNLLEIVKDISTAAKEKDMVLMMDALENGICEYITMLFPEGHFEGEKVRVYE